MNKLQQKYNRRFYTLLSQGTVAALGLLAIAGSPARASSLISGNFSLFLECNNDIIIQTFDPNSSSASGWHYTDDAKGDNTDGFLYDILGMATMETDSEVVVVLNSNVPLEGTGFDRQTNPVMFGDLFFSSGDAGQSFTEAMESGNLFGIHFAADNEAEVDDAGVYSQVIAKGVGVNNFGHLNYQNYQNLVDYTVDNFWGDLDSPNPYLDVTGPGYNVIAQGNKVENDGFQLLGMNDDLLADFSINNFANAGTDLIAFKFNKSALAYQPTLQEQAAELGVTWEWDDDFAQLDTQISDLTESKEQWNNNVTAEREKIDYLQAAWERKKASKDLEKINEKLSAASPVLTYLQDKMQKWEAMSPQEQANAAPEDVLTGKDEEDLKFQARKTNQYQRQIAEIEENYTPEELATAADDFKDANKKAKREYPDYKNTVNTRNDVSNQLEAKIEEKEELNNEIEEILLAARKEQVQEVVTAAAAIEEELETERGGPRTSANSGGIPTTRPNEATTPMVSVPESSSTVGLVVLGLGLVGSQLRKRR